MFRWRIRFRGGPNGYWIVVRSRPKGRVASLLVWVTGVVVLAAPAFAASPAPFEQAQVGWISGFVLDDTGQGVQQGRVDVFAEDGTYLHTTVADPGSGFYQTIGLLDAGTYYLLMYNGDDQFFIDFFPQWYGGAPLLRSDRAVGVTLTTGSRSNINAALLPAYDDMFDSVFIDSIAWMQFTGITQGCARTLYCPDDPVTRGQMAAFLVRALFLSDDGGGDLFIDDDQSVFEGAIDRLGTAGITRGCNPPANTRFCPDDEVTRGQMAAFLKRALEDFYLAADVPTMTSPTLKPVSA